MIAPIIQIPPAMRKAKSYVPVAFKVTDAIRGPRSKHSGYRALKYTPTVHHAYKKLTASILHIACFTYHNILMDAL
jgi:hypothetical protein